MYCLLQEPLSKEWLGSWEEPLGAFSEILGYTYLGSVLLRKPQTQEYLVLHPLMHGKNAKQYGVFASTAAFEEAVLKDPAFVSEVLRPDDLALLQARLGPVGPMEAYFPVPYPLIGGSGHLSTYDKGNVWVFVDLVGQTLGVG